jgi:uncharacterized protein (TIGR03382 family)
VNTRIHGGLASALAGLVLFIAGSARAQLCSADAGCDAGTDAGPSDAGTGDAGASDGGMSIDASVPDAGVSDAGMDAGGSPGNTAACSCETAVNSDGLIHVCTGSFDRDVCRTFDCQEGSVRSARCSDQPVRLCCTMPARMLYSQLYEDCTHANCESGFSQQCTEFGGTISVGACQAPELPDDPDTETGDGGCSVGGRPNPAAWSVLALALGLLLARRRTRARAPSL